MGKRAIQIPMNDIQFVQVFDTSNDLVEETTGLWFLDSLVLNNVIEKLAS